MKKHTAIIIVISFFLSAQALAAGSSTNYKITTEVLDSGGNTGKSTSYSLMGKTRDRAIDLPSSSSYKIGEGFLRTAYYSALSPFILTVDPTSAQNTETTTVTLTGGNFVTGATVTLSLAGQPDITGVVKTLSSGKIVCEFPITGAVAGSWTVTVTNPDKSKATSTFKITYPGPTVSEINPNKGDNNGYVSIISLTGKYFRTGAKVKLVMAGEKDIQAEDVVIDPTGTKITCRFNINGATVGLWDVVVVNDDDQSATLPMGFKIQAPSIAVTVPVVATPNPFDPAKETTTISYSLSRDADINVYIFDMRARRIWQFTAPAGTPGGSVGQNKLVWDGITAFKEMIGSGVYIIHVTTMENGQIKTLSRTKLAVLK